MLTSAYHYHVENAIRLTIEIVLNLIRFRSHSLLPRDMAVHAFVSSTSVVEEQPLALGPRLNVLLLERGHSSTKPGRTRR
jgi:hypothetical protein